MAKSIYRDVLDDDDRYKRQRLAVMSDEQQQLAGKVQDWFRDSYLDKENRGVFDKMEQAELYWEGDANPPESDNDPASNTNIVNSTIEGQVAYLVEQNIAVEARARKVSSLPFRDKAVDLMEWCKDQNRMVRKMDVHERRRKKFGVGIFRVLFDADCLDGLGLPLIEPINPAYLYIDPVVTDIYGVQRGRFVIERANRSIESAREQFGDELADAIQPGYIPMWTADTFDEDEFQNDTPTGMQHYDHWFVWTHYWEMDTDAEVDDGEERPQRKVLRLIEMSACGVIFRDTKETGIPICEDDSRFPYFFTPDMYREGTVWAKATAELLIPQQDIIDDIDDQIRINARLTGNPQREVNIETGADPDKMSNEGGLIYPVMTNGGIKYLEPPEIPQYIPNRRNQAFQEAPIVSRWSFQMNGIKQSGVDTATESLAIQQGGTQGVSHDQKLLEETLAEVFEYCLVLMMENYTEEEVFRITGVDGQDKFFALNPSQMLNVPKLIPASDAWRQQFQRDFPEAESIPEWRQHPENLTERIALDIKVTVGSGLPSNKAFIFQMINQAYQAKAITPPEYRTLLRDYVGLPVPETPPAPPVPPQVPGAPVGPLPGVPGAGAPNPDVAGLTAGGAPGMSGGVA